MEEPGAYLTAMQQLNGEVKVEVTYACTRDSGIAICSVSNNMGVLQLPIC